ncbi:MAG: hypothetical protein V2B18_05900, partial [Pseudomonadota bacterium]
MVVTDISDLPSEISGVTNAELQQIQAIGATIISAAAWANMAALSTRLQNLTDAEVEQLEDIGTSDISATEWANLAAMSLRVQNLTDAEVQQLENIGAEAISATEWGYLAAMNQGVATTDSPSFAGVKVNSNGLIAGDTTTGRVMRQLSFVISDGTNADTILVKTSPSRPKWNETDW